MAGGSTKIWLRSVNREEPLAGIRSVGWSTSNFEEHTRVKSAALITTVQGQHGGRRVFATLGRRRRTEEEGERTVTDLKNVRRSAPPLFSPPRKVSIAEGGTLQHQVDSDGRKRKAHALFPHYEWDARLVPTLTHAGHGGSSRNGPLAPTLTRAGLGGVLQ